MNDTALDKVIAAVREAGDKAALMQKIGTPVKNKNDQFGTHFLTEADTASERILIKRLAEIFPGEPITSEEKENNPDVPATGSIADPVDGTPCFIHGCDEWGVMVSHLTDHQPDMAVIYIPNRNILAYAIKGQGCYLNDQKITLGRWPQEMRDKTLIGMELGPWYAKWDFLTQVFDPLVSSFGVRSHLSAAYGIAALLMGQTGAWISANVGNVWDFAPAVLMLQESGGWVSDFGGKPVTFKRLGPINIICAVNKDMAGVILRITIPWSIS